MSYGPDPFEASQREALQATDALLDRIGSRAPVPEDLDDPLVAALALMAAEIDLDAVPVDLTRAAVEHDLTQLNLAGPRPAAPENAVVDERTGLVLDLREVARASSEAEGDVLRRRHSRLPPAPRDEGEEHGVRRTRPGAHLTSDIASAAVAPPRSLPRSGTRPQGSPPEGRRAHRLNPAAAFVAVIAALALGIGVSAAVTGGRSVNPLTGLQQVVAQVTGGRTTEQTAAYQAARRKLDAAEAALKRGDRTEARAELQTVNPENPALASDDVPVLEKRKAALEDQLGR